MIVNGKPRTKMNKRGVESVAGKADVNVLESLISVIFAALSPSGDNMVWQKRRNQQKVRPGDGGRRCASFSAAFSDGPRVVRGDSGYLVSKRNDATVRGEARRDSVSTRCSISGYYAFPVVPVRGVSLLPSPPRFGGSDGVAEPVLLLRCGCCPLAGLVPDVKGSGREPAPKEVPAGPCALVVGKKNENSLLAEWRRQEGIAKRSGAQAVVSCPARHFRPAGC